MISNITPPVCRGMSDRGQGKQRLSREIFAVLGDGGRQEDPEAAHALQQVGWEGCNFGFRECVIAVPNLSQCGFTALLWRLSKLRSINGIYGFIGEKKDFFSTLALCSICVPDAEQEQGYFISPPALSALQLDLSPPRKLRAK